MTVSPARSAAFDILLKIETDHAFSSVLLPAAEEKLSPKDRGLCHDLTLGVLRRQLYLDRVIEGFTKGKRLDTEILVALRLGLYQLFYLDRIPDYSAINESVALVQRAKKTSAKGFVNAVLRRATREEPQLVYADRIDQASIETSHPRWLLEKWINDIGEADAIKLAETNNQIPAMAFRLTAKGVKSDPEITRNFPKSGITDNAFISDGDSSKLADLAEKGLIYFQDEGSQLVGQAAAAVAGRSLLDVCAAPGSKTTQIASITSAHITAGDLHWPRVEFLRNSGRAQGIESVNVVQYDAETELPFEDHSFDCVLVDAPCTGTGTIRHNPEIRYLLKPGDFEELSSKQLRILLNASKMARTGGQLIYSTCSLEPEENEAVCSAFLDMTSGFRVEKAEVPERLLLNSGYARTLPHRDGVDGFFIAVFTRV